MLFHNTSNPIMAIVPAYPQQHWKLSRTITCVKAKRVTDMTTVVMEWINPFG